MKCRVIKKRGCSIVLLLCCCTSLSFAQEAPASSNAEELAKKLSNPVANLISVPFQNNTDYGIGKFNGSRNTLNIQPVVPIPLSKNLNMIARLILPVIAQRDIYANDSKQTGLSDATLTAFFAPSNTKSGLTWAVGPAFLIPTATDDVLGTQKFGIGPSALILKQTKGYTYGFLVNQIWSIAGNKDRDNVSQLFLQPFLAYNWKSGAGLSINAEVTENWAGGTTTAFINPIVTGVTKLGKQTISIGVGPRIPIAGPSDSRPDFGFRSVLTFVFPK